MATSKGVHFKKRSVVECFTGCLAAHVSKDVMLCFRSSDHLSSRPSASYCWDVRDFSAYPSHRYTCITQSPIRQPEAPTVLLSLSHSLTAQQSSTRPTRCQGTIHFGPIPATSCFPASQNLFTLSKISFGHG